MAVVVEHYIAQGEPAWDSGKHLTLYAFAGRTWVAVGTHRFAAAMARKDATFVGRWVEIDRDGTVRFR